MSADTRDPRHPVVLCWHMHQPEYRIGGTPLLPWVYIHALRGYADMASHVEAVPGARAVFNFSPILLEQLLDVALQAQAAWTHGTHPAEPLLAALLSPPPPETRARVLGACLRAHEHHGYQRFPDYAELAWRAAAAINAGADAIAALDDGLVQDLVCWYHLINVGEHARRSDPRVGALMARRRAFGAADRRLLLGLVAETLGGIVPRYRALAWSGRIELSMSPYFHPLTPLLIDFRSARDAAPDTPLPPAPYPGGRARAEWHLRAGRDRFESIFGLAPRGCWPSEAAVSDDTLALMSELGFDWAASSATVLGASLQRHGMHAPAHHHQVYRRTPGRTAMFFRDDGLSDRIGFVYKDWRARDAVDDLIIQLERAADVAPRGLTLVALDGENPWEYYADNGIDFVRGLYRRLAEHPRLRLATFSECVDDGSLQTAPLPPLVAGSWVHGQLLTWAGHAEKNHAWQLLVDAKRRFDALQPPGPAALHALGACEGSDWFWWPGGHHITSAIRDFDELFRAHLRALYAAMNEPSPAVLHRPFAQAASGAAEGEVLGAMRRGASEAATP